MNKKVFNEGYVAIAIILGCICLFSTYIFRYGMNDTEKSLKAQLLYTKIEDTSQSGKMWCAVHHIYHAKVLYVKPINNKGKYKNICKIYTDCCYSKNYINGKIYNFHQKNAYQELCKEDILIKYKSHECWYYVVLWFIFTLFLLPIAIGHTIDIINNKQF